MVGSIWCASFACQTKAPARVYPLDVRLDCVPLLAVVMALAPTMHSIVGQPIPNWPQKSPAQWIQGGPRTLSELRGKVVLVRFFTDADCPHCLATAPSLNEFHRAFAARGLVVIGMYTPKPEPRRVSPEAVAASVKG